MAESENATHSVHTTETTDTPAGPPQEAADVEMHSVDSDEGADPVPADHALPTKVSSEEVKKGGGGEEEETVELTPKLQEGEMGEGKGKESKVDGEADGDSVPLTTPPNLPTSAASPLRGVGSAEVDHVKEGRGAGEDQVALPEATEEECDMDTLPSSAQGDADADGLMDTQTDTRTDAQTDIQEQAQSQLAQTELQKDKESEGSEDRPPDVDMEPAAPPPGEAEHPPVTMEETRSASTQSTETDRNGLAPDRSPTLASLPTALPVKNGEKAQETGVNGQLADEPHALSVQQRVETVDSGRASLSPPVKIKDEPVDEEYDRALAPQSAPVGIKDEPDAAEEFGQQHKTTEELKISAVFSVGGNSTSTAPSAVTQPAKAVVAPSKTVTLTAPVTPLPPLPPPNLVRVSCSGCKKVLLKGQTAYQRKGSSQLFCSTICLTGYTLPAVKSVLKKTCHYCFKEIENPKDVIIAPVDMAGTVKDFCSQTCLSAFDFKRKTAVSTLAPEGVTIKCSVCQKVTIIRHEVNYQGSVHKLCSDACFSRFRSSNNLTMNCCENCGGYCYSGSDRCHTLHIEGDTKKLCSPSCVTAYKMKSVKVTPCTMCRNLRSSAEMVEHTTSQGKTELFCNASCVTAYKVQTVSTSGAVLPCNHCKVSAVPQYHLAMSDGSMRNFCSYDCVISFQTAFNKTTSQSLLNVIPPGVLTSAVPAPSPAAPTTASSSSPAPTTAPQVSAPAPTPSQPAARGPYRLICKHCYRLFASKPELIEFKGQMVQFCGKKCSEEFKKVHFVMARCEYCKIDKVVKEVKKINKQDCSFCSEGCKLLYKHDLAKRWGNHCHTCSYCGNTAPRVVRKHFAGKMEEFCGNECMSHYTVLFYQMSKCDGCKRQGKLIESLKWLGEMKHFCNLQCLLQFCSQQASYDPRAKAGSTVPALQAPATGAPEAPPTAAQVIPSASPHPSKEATPVIANVVSLASAPTGQPTAYANTALQGAVPGTQAKVIEHASTQTDALKLPAAPPVRVLKNKALLCKPISQNKGTSCKPHTQSTETQTDEMFPKVVVLPVPVPVFVPVPLHLYTQYTPCPVGLPLPLPVPMFLPTTLDSAERIVETIQEIKEKIPANPYEADLILMADLLAEDEEKDKPVSHGDQGSSYSGDLESEAVSTPHSLEDETSASSNKQGQGLGQAPDQGPTPATPSPPLQQDLEADFPIGCFDPSAKEQSAMTSPSRQRGRRRPRDGFPPRKRGRKRAAAAPPAGQVQEAQPPAGGLKLYSMYGVNAWKNWVQWRNKQPDLEKPRFGTRPVVLKEDVAQCSTAELSYGLCCFISEVRRPNGEPYTPDSIFYLCLGIQQHLFENGRMENIFTDLFYSKFTSEITKLLKDWKPTILPSGYLHSRVEEEYLWECKQLGAYSPIVLLNTLLFFSTKLFHLKTLPQHRRLSFAHVMRCTRTLKNNSKTNFLRFYPPVPKEPANTAEKAVVPAKRKKEDEEEEEVMEIPENTENPLRCPVRLYEFYLSKCSDSVKQRTDLFYLQPERSCVPNSPLWYSSTPLESATLETMLTRILTVREVHLDGEKPLPQTATSDDETSE
ncbi:hypothetical protein MATL_G00232730 [Megalops atlanticus]|uniref:TRASH domain-containing protein n=1 Tax=Megalops atlanticus TaxID=7932 RepID=A0A9D3PGI7_MEGAT|nr:hypothetical protein MATL_G00232730 [Megalops atlanticus]